MLNVDPGFYDQTDFQTKEKSWKEAIIDNINNNGKMIPIISNSFTNNLVFIDHDRLVKKAYAASIEYPMVDQGHNLARMSQYQSVEATSEIRVKREYLEFLKDVLRKMAEQSGVSSDKLAELEQQFKELSVSELCKFLEHPRLDSRNPLMLLAHLPLPIYLTTSYHSFLEMALAKARRAYEVEICPWHDNLNIPSVFERDKNYSPTPERPLVYHLHGLDKYPESLVLTEDDHLDFLTNVSDRIHDKVTAALRLSSLVVLGYHLPDWGFRVLFRGIIKSHRTLSLESVAVQQDKNADGEEDGKPSPIGNVTIQLDKTGQEKAYLKKYLDQQVKFKVMWTDDPGDFIRELYQGWKGE